MKALIAMMVVLFFVLSSIASIIAYWIFEPEVAVAYVVADQTQDAKGRPKAVFRPGETVYTFRTLYASRAITHTKAWRVVQRDENRELVLREEIVPVPLLAGETKRVHRLTLPRDMKPGIYRIRVFVRYQMNPLREVQYELLPPAKFEVAP